MSTFPVYHGITLASNSWIENLVIEKFAADPVPVEAGRIWFNTTDKVFRQSTLNGSGAVVVKTFATVEELTAANAALQSALTAETSARVAADNTLQANIDTVSTNLSAEVTRASGVEATLRSDLTAESAARTAADNTLQDNIEAEAAARTDADTTLSAAITSEVNRATAAEATLRDNLSTEVTRATTAEGSLQASIASEATARQLADAALQASIDALGSAFNYVGTLSGGADAANAFALSSLTEKDTGDYYKVTTAGYFKVALVSQPFYANVGDGLVWNLNNGVDKIDNTDYVVSGTPLEIAVSGSIDSGFQVAIDGVFSGRVSTLESGLASEITARTGADSALQSAIDTEVTARQTAVSNEATARQEADATLQSNINKVSSDLTSEASTRAAADTTLQSNIDAEAVARGAADTTLASNLAAEVTRSTAAETTLQANIDAEAAARGAADATLTAAVAAEVTARQAADTSLQAAINTEVIARTTAVSGVQSELDVTQAGAGLSTTGAYVAAEGANYIAGATSLANATVLLDTALFAEASARTAADSSLNTRLTTVEGATNGKIGDLATLTTDAKDTLVNAINEVQAEIIAEASARTAADSTLTSNLAAEVTARTLADATLQANIDAEAAARIAGDSDQAAALNVEVTARKAADTALQSNIDAEATARSLADTTLQANINAEATARSLADTTLQANINAEATARTAAIDAEATARIAGDATLTSALNAETTARTTADTSLQTAIETEKSRAELAEADIRANIDAKLAGLTWKNSVKALADSNIDIATGGLVSVDGVALVAGNRVLLNGQTNSFENGIYVVGTGPWARSTDMDATTPLNEFNSAAVFVEMGTVYGDTGWTEVLDVTAIGTDPVSFTQFNGAAGITAGAGMTKVGNTLNVVAGDSSITVDADSIKVSADYTSARQAEVAAESTARELEDTSIRTALAAEVTRATAAEGVLTTNLSAEVTRATAAEGVLTTNLAAEVTAREAALDAEAAARSAADTTLQGAIAAEVARATAAEGVLTTNLAAEVTARQAADVTLQNAIDAEAAARQAADTTLQANIDAEITARSNAVSAEAAARSAADTTLQANIEAEVTARKAADGDLTTLTTTAKTDLVSAINEVKGLVGTGTAAVKSAYNATIFTYESKTPATTHTLTHNLNAGFVDFGVMIQRGDGKWYNDIASIQVVDANSAVLYLSTALNVKVICRSAATLA